MLHKIVDRDGNVYKGELVHGRRHGRGTIVYADTRDVYQGDFENDVPHGAGRYYRAGAENGLFEGLWKNGELTQVKKGRACIEDSNGDHYDGGFDHWKRHGKGTLKSANGDVYDGYWKQGLRHGFGILISSDGTKYEGYFKEDELMPDSNIDDFDEKTIATTASEFETMGLNPYGSHLEKREYTRQTEPDETRDSESDRKTSEERRTKTKVNKEYVHQPKQTRKPKNDVKRKLELLEKAKNEGKGQYQRDRRKHLLDAKRDLGKKKKSNPTDKSWRENSEESEIGGKRKNGFLKKFSLERNNQHESSNDVTQYTRRGSNISHSNVKGVDQSTPGDIVNRQQSITFKSKPSSSRPPAHPHPINNDGSSILPPSRGRPTSGIKPPLSRKRSTSLNEGKISKIRPRSRKNKKEKVGKTKQEKSPSQSRGRSSTKSRSGKSRASSLSSFFRSKSKESAGKKAERSSTPSPSISSSKASNFTSSSQRSQLSHTLKMLGVSSDSDDPNFFTNRH